MVLQLTDFTLLFKGLGVDDVYIVLLALKNQGGYSLRHWLRAMKEVVVPVTMTSLVNASMFAVLNISDIPAIYLTSRVALYCIIALYLSVIFCFPAYCLLDLQRQENNRLDMLFCLTSSNDAKDDFSTKDIRNTVLYDYFYKPIVLGETGVRRMCHAVIILLSVAMFAVGCWGVTERQGEWVLVFQSWLFCDNSLIFLFFRTQSALDSKISFRRTIPLAAGPRLELRNSPLGALP